MTRIVGQIWIAAALLAACAYAGERTPAILIVGDSWAASITAENRDGFPAPDVFDDVLEANGLGQYETLGKKTAWAGRKASDWAKPQHLQEIRGELEAHPSVQFVHLIIGGNDFLSEVEAADFSERSPEDRAAQWESIANDVQTIVDACLNVRDDVTVVIAGYDYLDFEAASAFWQKEFHGTSTEQLNGWLHELGDRKKRLAEQTGRCEYVSNWGTLQNQFGNPPKSTPLPGGDPAKGMPESISPDGIHPNAEAHARLLQNAVDQIYKKRLSE